MIPMTPSPPLEVPDEADPVELDNLYPALVECFGIILLGYVAKRFNLISDVETKGISTFTTTFALPALIFGSLIRLSLHEVNWTFLGCICLAKSLLFMVVLIVSLFSVRPFNPGKCGLYAIFTTQSNDFALGYPILVAIYGKSHPECPSYLYLMAPISLVILNPIGFIFMESSRTQSQTIPLRKKIWSVFKGIVTNAIIIMTLLGVIFNFIFEGKPPAFLNQFLSTLGAAFSATALFVLGMRMVGSCNSLSKVPWMTTLILIALKIIVLPLVAREIVSQVIQLGPSANETEHLSNFAFIYGTFPTAPSVFVFSAQYDLDQDLIAFAMVACTVVAAPIMFVSAHLLSLTEIDPNDYIEDLDKFLLDLSIVGVCVAAWVTFVLVSTKKYTRFPHFMTLVLVLSQGMTCVGAILWSVLGCTHGWKLFLQFSFFAYGVYASRINTAILAIVLLFVQTRDIVRIARYKMVFLSVGLILPGILVMCLLLTVGRETEAHGKKTDPNFQYGETQAYVALTVLTASFLITVVAMILGQQMQHRRLYDTVPIQSNSADEASRRLLEATDNEEETSTTTTNSSQQAANGSSQVVNPSYQNASGVRPRVTTSNQERYQSRESPVPIEDLIAVTPPQSDALARPRQGVATACPVQCSSPEGGTGRPRQQSRYRCNSEHRQYCSSLLESYDYPPASEAAEGNEILLGNENADIHQTFRHNILLLFLTLSMIIGIALCVWTLVMDKKSGIYLELVFLDGFFNVAQGLSVLVLFGFDVDYLTLPIRRLYRKWRYGEDSLNLPPWEDLSDESKTHCQQFLKHHIENCMATILTDVKYRLITHRAVFRGTDLVDWLIELGLARDRSDGVAYARHLIKGRVIRHIENYLDFYDDCFIYTFSPRNAR